MVEWISNVLEVCALSSYEIEKICGVGGISGHIPSVGVRVKWNRIRGPRVDDSY